MMTKIKFLNTCTEIGKILETKKPWGLFCYNNGSDYYFGIDNTTGEVKMHVFYKNIENCHKWLLESAARSQIEWEVKNALRTLS